MDWDKLTGFLEEQLEANEGKKVLLTTRYIYLNKVLIGLLKLLLNKHSSRGVYIAIDRPYHYTSRILEKHGVRQEGLFFLDAISAASSEKLKKGSNVELLDSPFCNSLLSEAVEKLGPFSGTNGIDFIFLDNITVMLSYMDEKCIFSFLAQVVIKLSREGRTLTLIMVDKEAHPRTYEQVRGESDSEVEIPQGLLT